jgi:hypothetical protein
MSRAGNSRRKNQAIRVLVLKQYSKSSTIPGRKIDSINGSNNPHEIWELQFKRFKTKFVFLLLTYLYKTMEK